MWRIIEYTIWPEEYSIGGLDMVILQAHRMGCLLPVLFTFIGRVDSIWR